MLVGFGGVEKRHHQARDGCNPKTGESIAIAATTILALRKEESFQEMLSGQSD